MPPNPKRPARVELADDEQILRADDPRPQRVAQLPSTGTRRKLRKAEEHIPTSLFDTEADQEMQAEYGVDSADYTPAFLYVERGPGAGQLLEVKQGTLVVGRASVSDLRLQHPSISRRHTQLRRLGEQFFVKDLGSQNGTFVNKQRISGEMEVRPGDSIALGNALLRLRGPLARGEKAPSAGVGEKSTKSRVSTAVVARPSGQQAAPSATALKIAVFAGAVGFSLAAVLAFALVRTMSSQDDRSAASKPVAKRATPAAPVDDTERARLIDEAIKKKMAEQPPRIVHAEEEYVDAEPAPAPAKAPEVAKAPVVTTAPTRPAAAPVAAKKPARDSDDEAPAAKTNAGAPKRAQLLAAYEKGNAEASLEAAKKAGDKELADKLSRFLAAYDAANDAMVSNNGAAAIANFQKALALDEQLSSGWGKYGGEIRSQLAKLYVLVGMQFVSNGDTEKAKTAFQAAVKHDPNNQRAKAQLAKLQPAAAARSPDEAFDDEAPPTKPVPRKAVTPKSAIDDAFGD
jgi:pSer/pThr/pTyr-binding forkhead associated (FHA) protein